MNIVRKVITLFFVAIFVTSAIPNVEASHNAVVLTTSEDWRYAMMANGFAAAHGYPLLVTPGKASALDEKVKEKLKGFHKVYIIGDTNVVSKGIEDEINSLRIRIVEGYWGIRPERISGTDVFETSVALAGKWSETKGVIVARDDIFPDILVGSQLSGVMKAPVLFTSTNKIPSNVLTKIKDLSTSSSFTSVIIVGGPEAVSVSVENSIKGTGVKVERIGGKDRFETSTLVAEKFIEELNGKVTTVILTDAASYEGALSMGVKAYNEKAPILYTASLKPVVKEFLAKHEEITNAIINVAPGKDASDIVEGFIETAPNVVKVDVLTPAALPSEEVTAINTLLQQKGITVNVKTEVSDVDVSISTSETILEEVEEVVSWTLSGGGGGGNTA